MDSCGVGEVPPKVGELLVCWEPPPGVQAVVMNPGFIWVPIAPPRKGWLDAWLEELHGLARKAAAAAAGGDSQR